MDNTFICDHKTMTIQIVHMDDPFLFSLLVSLNEKKAYLLKKMSHSVEHPFTSAQECVTILLTKHYLVYFVEKNIRIEMDGFSWMTIHT